MTKSILIFISLVCCITLIQNCTSHLSSLPTDKVLIIYNEWADSLRQRVARLNAAVEKKEGLENIRACFGLARLAYKHTELFAEYYNPSTAKAINGPALDEVEPDNPEYPEAPTGFQVIEEFIYPQPDSINYKDLIIQTRSLKDAVTRLVMVSQNFGLTDAHVFDAVRLELFRIITLGISGFDSPVAFLSLAECKETLLALQDYVNVYSRRGDNFSSGLKRCITYLDNNQNFDSFNRAVFIAEYINPLCRQLHQLQTASGIPFFSESRALNANAVTLFDKEVFNPAFYSPNRQSYHDKAKIELGEQLFKERMLSADGKRSCATCHQPAKSYTDGLAKNSSFDGRNVIRRNTPTILYAALQGAQFADSRLVFLEDQAKQVIENPDEMHGNLSAASGLLNRDTGYRRMFAKAFPDQKVSEEKIQQALAVFIRSKATFTSRFDDYMRGDLSAMSQQEIKGLNLFMGKAKCGTCHFMPLFNGNAPPAYYKTESEVLGVPSTPDQPYTLDEDEGKYMLYRSSPHKNSFKTSTLRNIEHTAPYMHNGVFVTLNQVLDFYNKGGGTGLGIKVDNQTLPSDELKLNAEEQDAIIAFMKTLSDR